MLQGVRQADSGRIYADGKEGRIASQGAAVDLGIGMVGQHSVLAGKGLCCDNDRGVVALKDPSLTVHAEGIVDVARVDGNGQRQSSSCATGYPAVEQKQGYGRVPSSRTMT